ncbi:putative holin [Dyella sp. ASV21]|uniref:putative holin n=1 Tax=Dyella sp. ASV21 TaxID=2795114 RepID=UPI0018ECE000|nr:putative holin [Dyella sp. ASV21]
MTEPATTTLAGSAAIVATATTTALLPGVDGNALTGAIAGGALFVTMSRDLPLIKRAIYLLISVVVGYLAAPELMQRFGLVSSGVAAFLAASIAITVATQLIDRIRSLSDLSTLFTKRGA